MFHVVRKRAEGGNDDLRADHLKVRFYQRRRNPVDAEHWEDASFSNDLAVIRARVTGLSFDLNRLGNPQTAKKGDFVYAIGQPADDLWGVTYQPGSISDVGSVWIKLQSAYVENGHSGGPLIDQQGRILGLIKQTGGSTPQALRIDRALDVLRLDLKLPVQLEIGDAPTVSPKPGEARKNPRGRITPIAEMCAGRFVVPAESGVRKVTSGPAFDGNALFGRFMNRTSHAGVGRSLQRTPTNRQIG